MRRALTNVIAIGVTLAAYVCASPASAAPENGDVWGAYRLSLDANVGFGATTGLIGTSVELSISRAFALRAGVGYDRSINFTSLADKHGVQWEFMPTLRAPFGHGAVGARLGVSGGEYAWQQGLSGYLVHVWPNAVWFNLELIADLRWDGGFQAGVSAGFGSLLNSTDYNCGGTGPDCGGDGGTTIPYIGFRVGYSFGL